MQVDNDMVQLAVTDDGRGVPPAGRRSGMANMRARAERLNGRMDIGRGSAGGTYVTWSVPVR